LNSVFSARRECILKIAPGKEFVPGLILFVNANATRSGLKIGRTIRADASKISAIKFWLAFWLDTELLLIKIIDLRFATISNRGSEFFLAAFEGSSLSGVGASLRAK
jgi:hypothetical protein